MGFSLDDLVKKITEHVFGTFFKHAVYCFTARENVKNLKIASDILRSKSKDVQNKIMRAERHGMEATEEAKGWLRRVDDIISEEEEIHGKFEQRSITFGNCPLDCWSNYEISKNATKKHDEIQVLLDTVPADVAVEPLPPSAYVVPVPSDTLSSRDVMLEEAIQCIKGDQTGTIGIWGLGGAGKTHLLKRINNSFGRGTFFDHVIFVVASKECSVGKIQDEIVKQLSLQKVDNMISQASIIFNFLSKRSFLLLLDDLWDRIDLQEVGIPDPLQSTNELKRKVVLTTRSISVCGLMEVRKQIEVTCLHDDEAWQLFKEKVGQERLSSSPLVALAKKLVEELKGLPLALITIGRAMYAKDDPYQWEFCISQMKQSSRGKGDPMECVFKQLKFSYDHLKDDTLRECFLTCALWPEDCPIHVDDLMECWMGLGLVSECDIHSSYRKVYDQIGELKSACLLESWKNGYVKMHDVIRDMAIWISCGCGENNNRWVVQAGSSANTSANTICWSNAECISLMRNRMKKLHPSGHIPDLTKLKALYLQKNAFGERIIAAIKCFTALTYLDLSNNYLINLPEEVCALVNLVYLNLSFNRDLCKVPERLGELVKLKFLYLRETSYELHIPTHVISSFKALEVLDLMDGPEFTQSIFQGLCTLENLKAIDVKVEGTHQYQLLSEAANIPIRCLVVNELWVRSAFCLSGGIFSVDTVRRTLFKLDILSGNMDQIIASDDTLELPFDSLSALTIQKVHGLRDIMWKGISPQTLFPRLTRLSVATHLLGHVFALA